VEVFYQLAWCKKIVTENGIAFFLYVPTQLGDNRMYQTMLDTLQRLASVNDKFTLVAICAVCPTPHFDTPLDGLHRSVLL